MSELETSNLEIAEAQRKLDALASAIAEKVIENRGLDSKIKEKKDSLRETHGILMIKKNEIEEVSRRLLKLESSIKNKKEASDLAIQSIESDLSGKKAELDNIGLDILKNNSLLKSDIKNHKKILKIVERLQKHSVALKEDILNNEKSLAGKKNELKQYKNYSKNISVAKRLLSSLKKDFKNTAFKLKLLKKEKTAAFKLYAAVKKQTEKQEKLNSQRKEKLLEWEKSLAKKDGELSESYKKLTRMANTLQKHYDKMGMPIKLWQELSLQM